MLVKHCDRVQFLRWSFILNRSGSHQFECWLFAASAQNQRCWPRMRCRRQRYHIRLCHRCLQRWTFLTQIFDKHRLIVFDGDAFVVVFHATGMFQDRITANQYRWIGHWRRSADRCEGEFGKVCTQLENGWGGKVRSRKRKMKRKETSLVFYLCCM